MEVIAMVLGVAWGITIVWGSVLYLLQLVRIEELEMELKFLK